MSKIQDFINEELGALRVSTDKDGNPWFVLKDVCAILGQNTKDAPKDAAERLEPEEKGRDTIPTPGGNQMMLTVSESGLYYLICTSRKPKAKEFRLWVTGTVLPSIRKHSVYVDGQEELSEEDLCAVLEKGREAVALCETLRQKNKALNEKVGRMIQIVEEKDRKIWSLENNVVTQEDAMRRRIEAMDPDDVLAAGYY